MSTSRDWVDLENAALFTDLYQLTMLQAYFMEEMDEPAVFDLFVRRLGKRNYLLACGLETVLEYLEALRFSDEAIAYLRRLGRFDAAFLDYLRDFRFEGDVYAVREGTPVFENEPLVEVVAPIGQAQLVETFLLNQITFQTNLATKAARVRRAAGDRMVADFGMRRMHAADAALKGARAFYVAGLDSTSHVLAGQIYGIPVSGTMAHSYIEAHDSEMEAFRAFSGVFPSTILLVDTYDTIEGVRRVVELARELGDAFRVTGIRLDSGDLGALAREARAVLDEAGLQRVQIVASGSLDEFRIVELLDGGAPIDGFGVGTRMGTVADQPYLDSAYKLAEYAGRPRMKLSSAKSNLPGRKQVYRMFEDDQAAYDVIATHDEPHEGDPLLELVMQGGERTEAGRRGLEEARRYATEAQSRLPERLLALEVASQPYEVRLSNALQRRLDETRASLAAMEG